jgi:hypothetical protein
VMWHTEVDEQALDAASKPSFLHQTYQSYELEDLCTVALDFVAKKRETH